MEINDFIKKFASQFDEADDLVLHPETKFRDIEGWSSLVTFSIIAMIDDEYNVKIKGDDISKCQTIEDLYKIVNSRIN